MKDLFLQSELAKKWYFNYAKDMPIIDYHCHLEPKEIYENKPFVSLYDLWLSSDHYKWRLMRTAGVDEYYITGGALAYEKFFHYAKSLSGAVGNPLYIWSHLELQKYFGINLAINEENAKSIWDLSIEILKKESLTPTKCMEMSNVEAVFTTDDILSALEYHKKIAQKGLSVKVLPTFRGDRAVFPNKEFVYELEKSAQKGINNLCDYFSAIKERIKFFKQNGAKLSDFSVETFCETLIDEPYAEQLFQKIKSGEGLEKEKKEELSTYILYKLIQDISNEGLALQLHIGATRNNNTAIFNKLGKDAGCDGMSDKPFIKGLAKLLDRLIIKECLPNTVLYNLNPVFNDALSVLAGCFSCSKSKVQLGPAWWFCDHKNGVYEQLKVFSQNAHLESFVGMLTDSRSFLSYTRHDYFRRILCNYIAELSNNAEYFYTEKRVQDIIEKMCYKNAKELFNI